MTASISGAAGSPTSLTFTETSTGRAPTLPHFLYLPLGSTNGIAAYSIDQSTGMLTNVLTTGLGVGNNPWGAAIVPSGPFLYVTNRNSNTVSGYTINSSTGDLTVLPGSPWSTSGGTPQYAMVNPAGTLLYVADVYGGPETFGINQSTGALTSYGAGGGSAFSLSLSPSGNFLFVSDFLDSYLIVSGVQTLGGFSGTTGNAVDPTGRFLYATDFYGNAIHGFTIDPSTGILTPMPALAWPTGNNPWQIAMHPSGKFLYVVNGSVWGYNIDSGTGALTPITGSPWPGGDTYIQIEPTGTYLYGFYNSYESLTVSTINPTTGALTLIQSTSLFWFQPQTFTFY